MTGKPVLTCHLSGVAVALVGGVMGLVMEGAIAQPLPNLAQAPSLQGSWRLANMTQPPFPTPMLPSNDLTADFANGRVSGSGGCNRFNGSYTTQGKQIKMGPLATTFKACEQGTMEQESRFLTAMQQATRYSVNQDGLQIYYKNEEGEGVLRFTSQTVRGLW